MGQAAVGGNMLIKRVPRQPLRQGLRARRDPKTFQKHTLRGETGKDSGGGCLRNRLEIDMGGQISGTGGGKRVNLFVGSKRLQRIAQTAPIPVIDDQSSATVGGNRGTQLGGDPRKGGTQLNHITGFGIAQPVFQRVNRGRLRQTQRKPAVCHPHHM